MDETNKGFMKHLGGFDLKKIDETKSEILQLENNLQFFKHVAKDNPLVKDVYKNIDNHKEQLALWKEKLVKIKAIQNG